MVKTLHPLGPISERIELPPDSRVRCAPAVESPNGSDAAAVEVEPATAARAALDAPLNFPPFAASVVPGDQLAIVIDESVPEAAKVLRGVLEAAAAAEVAPQAISIVASDEHFAKHLRAELGDQVRVVVHDPDDQLNLAILAFDEKNGRLLVNRTIFEADVVLPIGCARLASIAGSGVFECLFPRMSDAETIGRMRTPSQRGTAARLAKSRRKAEEAGWLVGAALVMQVVPGREGKVAAIVAGEAAAVAERAEQLCEQIWALRVPQQAGLVIGNVTGGELEQNWENIGRSLATIEPLVEEGGAVAICSDLDAVPGHALGQLAGNSDFESVEANVRNDHSPDSWTAWQLARALQRGPVYFLSRLDPDDVEELGLAPIESLDELERLARGRDSCIVLDDSQYVSVRVANDA